jgi:SSS family solute:Na+ symporter
MTLLLILIAYAVLMVGVGALVSRRVKSADSFFVAGRGLGAGLIFSTMLASNIGSGSTVGAAGLGYRDGLSAWWWVGSAGVGSLILAFTVGPKIWRIARDNNLLTVGDYLEFRYNRAVRGLASMLVWIGSLTIVAGQLIAIAWVLDAVAGTSKAAGCLIAAAVVTTYFTLGGLHATARVNVIQLVVKLVGFSIALAYLLIWGGGVEQLRAPEAAGVVTPEGYFGIAGKGWPAVLRYLVLLAPAFVISPGLLQKAFGARDERAVRVGIGLNAAGLLAYAIAPVLIGMLAHARFPGLTNNELALPTMVTQVLPLWLGALLLGSIVSAELSAADAGLFMLSTSLGNDLYRSFIRPEASEGELVRIARLSAIICGAIAAGLAILLPTVIAALTIFYSLLTAALLLPLIAGLYSRRVTGSAAVATIIVSVATTFILEMTIGSPGLKGLPPLLVGIAAGGVVMIVFTLFWSSVRAPIGKGSSEERRSGS